MFLSKKQKSLTYYLTHVKQRRADYISQTVYERVRLRCVVDAIVSALYGLEFDDLRWILHNCDHPNEKLKEKEFCRTLDPKGFWRIDKELDPELRQTVLTLVAFDALLGCVAAAGGDRHRGIEAFAALNDGQGWLIPETLRLSDHGLGHDERARQPQPVASRLGPRFPEDRRPLSPEEARAECERHARAILGDAEFDRRFLNRPADPAPRPETPCNEPGDRDSMKGRIQQKRLFD